MLYMFEAFYIGKLQTLALYTDYACNIVFDINPLNTVLNPICHLLVLLGAYLILHVSRIRVNTLRTGNADLRLYITIVQEGWSKSAFLTRAWLPRIIHLITQYMEHISEWSC